MRQNQCIAQSVTFIVYRDVPTLNSLKIPQAEDIKYLELHLDHRLNWKKPILTKRKHHISIE